MDTSLPSNATLVEFSEAVHWNDIEEKKRKFNALLDDQKTLPDGDVNLELFSKAVGAPVIACYDMANTDTANVLMTEVNGRNVVLGSVVSKRYRSGKGFIEAIVPYNLNPSVNHTNIHETDNPATHIRALGAELELGLLHEDGAGPNEEDMQKFITHYQAHARRLGITPQMDREACQYQVEAHVAPGIGYHRTRQSLDGIFQSLIVASEATGLKTAILAAYPVKSDFRLTDHHKVRTAVDLMVDVNSHFPEYTERLTKIKQRYHIDKDANVVEAFRLQGCHIHLDLAGRSESLGMLTFYTMLRSLSAIAGGAVLKGGPFVNGTCDAELLCTREYLRSGTVTGRYLEVPLSPHLQEEGLNRYGDLMYSERVNAVARAMLYEDGLGQPISSMHNPIGRVRPDLGSTKRICTVESTGLPINISASRQAAVLTDLELSNALIESYFRRHGCNLEPMMEDRELWMFVGPLDTATFIKLQDESDRLGSDIEIPTRDGGKISITEFYERKRVYMHKHLMDVTYIAPRDIDDVYHSLQRMIEPPSGQVAETIEQYVIDYKLRSTGNWGKILRNAFIEEGGTPGEHDPETVLKVVHRVHNAIRDRYLPR